MNGKRIIDTTRKNWGIEMSETTFLRTAEVISLTGRTRRDAQVRVLRGMGIEHKVRPDGSVAVLRPYINQAFGGIGAAAGAQEKEVEPDWEAV